MPNNNYSKLRVFYTYLKENDYTYAYKGFYNKTKTVWQTKEADILFGNIDLFGINITLIDIPMITIKGEIFLPRSVDVINGYGVRVISYDEEYSIFRTNYYPFYKGTRSISYEMKLPKGTAETWKIGYSPVALNYPDGFYQNNRTTLDISKATNLSLSISHAEINMTITDIDIVILLQ